jgi:hypothetical protein
LENYQIYSEKFYVIKKINNQFRDYDFKKNLELKTALCETVEKLEEEPILSRHFTNFKNFISNGKRSVRFRRNYVKSFGLVSKMHQQQ